MTEPMTEMADVSPWRGQPFGAARDPGACGWPSLNDK